VPLYKGIRNINRGTGKPISIRNSDEINSAIKKIMDIYSISIDLLYADIPQSLNKRDETGEKKKKDMT